MVDQSTNFAVLRKCSIPEWILVDEDWKGFISFFKENISEVNVLTDEELVEIDMLEKDKTRTKVNLKDRMDNVGKKYRGIWSVNEKNLNNIKNQMGIDVQKEELFDELITKTSVSNLEAIEKLTAWRGKKSKLLLKEQTVTDECMKQMQELKEVKHSNERKIRELGQLYSKPAQNPLFMHQMPLSEFFRQLEQFNDNAKHFIRKNFNVQNLSMPADVDKQNDKTQVLNELKMVADRLLNAYNKLYLSEMTFKAKSILTNQFKVQNWSPSTLVGMRRDLLQMQRNIEMNEEQKQHLLYNLQEQAVELSQLDADALVYESNKKRMKRAKHRLEYLLRYANHISETMLLSEIFWVLLQFDMERMKSRSTYDSKLDTYRMDSMCNRRIEVLNMIRKESNDSLVHGYCNLVLEFLQKDLPDLSHSKISGPIKCSLSVDEFKSSIAKVFEQMERNSLIALSDGEFFAKVSSLEEFIRPILYDGPNVKPQYCSEWYRTKKILLDCELQQINKRNEVKKEECGHFIKKWSNDKYWRYLQVFWVWFMTEPKKVIKSLKLISTEVQQRSKNAAIASRPIAGIVRKR